MNKTVEMLKEQKKELESELAYIESEISGLEWSAGNVEEKIWEIDKKIENIRNEKQLKERVAVLDEDTSDYDEFTKCFMMASWFADKDDRIYLSHVDVGENDLVAIDGYKLIKIKCSSIPSKVKNTVIKWDVRSDWEEHAIQYENVKEPFNIREKADEVLSIAKENIERITKTTKATFYTDFGVTFHSKCAEGRTMLMRCNGINVGIAEKNLKLALDCMGNKEFNIGAYDDLCPILFENEETSIIIMPVKIWGIQQ